MPLDTRSKKREPVEAVVEFFIANAAEQAVKLNISKDSIKLDSDKVVKSTLLDISISGCAVSSPYIIPPGVVLNLKIDSAPFNIPGVSERKEPLNLSGKVKSCVMKAAGQYRLGVQFQTPHKEDVNYISSFISLKERRKDPRWDMTKE